MTTRTCSHGEPWQGSRVWNTGCWRCREVRDAYDRQTSRLNGQLSRGRWEIGDRERARSRWREGVGRRSEYWAERRRAGIDNRRELVALALDGFAVLDWDVWEAMAELTPRQQQVAVYVYGLRLGHRETADAIGIGRTTARDHAYAVGYWLQRAGVEPVYSNRSNEDLRELLALRGTPVGKDRGDGSGRWRWWTWTREGSARHGKSPTM